MQSLSKFPQTIKTSRLVLRTVAPTIENAKKFFCIINQNREFLEEWQGHIEYLRNMDDVLKNLEFRYAQIAKDEGILFGIYCDGDLIGRIRFFIDPEYGCELGAWLVQNATGKGYMSEALVALEKELFKFGFDKITLDIDDGNTKSENVAKRNGYKFVKRLPMASWAKRVGKCDSLIYEKPL